MAQFPQPRLDRSRFPSYTLVSVLLRLQHVLQLLAQHGSSLLVQCRLQLRPHRLPRTLQLAPSLNLLSNRLFLINTENGFNLPHILTVNILDRTAPGHCPPRCSMVLNLTISSFRYLACGSANEIPESGPV